MDKRSESQWDDPDYQSKMYAKYYPEIMEARERDAQHAAERDAQEKED
jgi:hypothetical protein